MDESAVVVNGPDVYDLKFFNENTGIITSQLLNVYSTTNGGDNWVLLGIKINMQQLQKIDSNAIYGCGARYNGNGINVFSQTKRMIFMK
ncbi:MAG: hypothetical protein NTY74_01080 [Ignavibacteriae bacterium]|nr:hypothetical protein [Ignavibacteriota bacterium]